MWTVLRTFIIVYLSIGALVALAFHAIASSGDIPHTIDLAYIGDLAGIVLMWPIMLLFVFIVIAAAAANGM